MTTYCTFKDYCDICGDKHNCYWRCANKDYEKKKENGIFCSKCWRTKFPDSDKFEENKSIAYFGRDKVFWIKHCEDCWNRLYTVTCSKCGYKKISIKNQIGYEHRKEKDTYECASCLNTRLKEEREEKARIKREEKLRKRNATVTLNISYEDYEKFMKEKYITTDSVTKINY